MAIGLSPVSLAQIAWRAPWLTPLESAGQSAAGHIAGGAATCEALNLKKNQIWSAGGAPPVHFVPQSALPVTQPYEDFIFKTGQVPTRNNLHDFFNGLCWLHFPQTKKRLNQLQAAQIAQDGVGQVRGAVRDALTLFDENAAFLSAPDTLWSALVAKDWQTLFVTQRACWADAHLVLFGHALLEKLVLPRKAITAHVYRVWPATQSIADIDRFVASDLGVGKIAAKPFAHLPVLGVPGWWPENDSAAFYDDKSVFRQLRVASQNLTFHGVKP